MAQLLELPEPVRLVQQKNHPTSNTTKDTVLHASVLCGFGSNVRKTLLEVGEISREVAWERAGLNPR